jgi:hypothetical protein
MYQISVYVPENAKEKVKQALFTAGAGRIGQYDQCCFEFKGTGQFRALKGANPHIGEINQVEYVTEYKLEMVCEATYLTAVVNAIKANHPYETPAFHCFKLE